MFKKYFPEVADIPKAKGVMIDYNVFYSQGGGQIKSILFSKDAIYPEHVDYKCIEKAWNDKDFATLSKSVTFEIFLQQYFNKRYLQDEQDLANFLHVFALLSQLAPR